MGETKDQAWWAAAAPNIMQAAAEASLAAGDSVIGSMHLLLGVLTSAALDDPDDAPGWLRRQLGFADDASPQTVANELGLGPRVPNKSQSPARGYSSTVTTALNIASIAAKAGKEVIGPRHLVGGLLFGAGSSAQNWIEQRQPIVSLRFAFVEFVNRGEVAEAERRFWRTQISQPPERRTQPAPNRYDVRRFTLADVATEHDALGFTTHVQALAEFLSAPDTRPPLTVSIEGEWGSGKSSFLRQLAIALGQGDHPRRVIWFNAWRFDKDESLWAAFAEQFFEKAPAGNVWRRGWARWRLIRGRVERKRLLRALGKFGLFAATFGLGIWSLWHVAGKVAPNSQPPQWIAWLLPLLFAAYKSDLVQRAEALFKPFDVKLGELVSEIDYESKRTFLSRFRDDFKLAQRTLVDDDRIFVFVDDLDRCEVPRAAELLQAINLMLTDDDKSEPSKLITVLGIDREKVAAAVAMRSEKLLPLLAPAAEGSKAPYDAKKALAFGHAYLEKFIQLPFRLPRARTSEAQDFLDRVLGKAEPRAVPPPPIVNARSQTKAAAKAAPEPTPLQQQTRQMAATATARLGNEGDLRAVLEAVAPALDFNPRRIIQFVNLFRLRVYLASARGLFDGPKAITLLQLGKVTALAQRWPELTADLLAGRPTLQELETLAVSGTELPSPLEDWMNDARLMDLLRTPPRDLAKIDLASLLDTWAPAAG